MADDAIRQRDEAQAQAKALQAALDKVMPELRKAEAQLATAKAELEYATHSEGAWERDCDMAQAQLAALREVLEEVSEHESCCPATDPRGIGQFGPCECWITKQVALLADTAAAAREHDARVRREALEEAADKLRQYAENVEHAEAHKADWTQPYHQGVKQGAIRASDWLRALAEEGE